MQVGVLSCAVCRMYSFDEDVSDMSWDCVSFGTGCIDMFGLLAQPCIGHGRERTSYGYLLLTGQNFGARTHSRLELLAMSNCT